VLFLFEGVLYGPLWLTSIPEEAQWPCPTCDDESPQPCPACGKPERIVIEFDMAG
jgi:hypothetical protein